MRYITKIEGETMDELLDRVQLFIDACWADWNHRKAVRRVHRQYNLKRRAKKRRK